MVLLRLLPACALLATTLAVPAFAESGTAQTIPQIVPQSQAGMQLSFSPVVKQAAPAVVNIYARQIVSSRRSPFADDPFFGDFFREFAPSQPRVQNALGSGVIVSADGLVVSNYHVVGEADQIRVVLKDRREYAAEVLLKDKADDLAVLKLKDAKDLPVLPLGDSDKVEVGDLVLAIGNPFGVGQTVSSGIVSGLGRSMLTLGSGQGLYLQTDAPINPGNSGGALVDMQGRLIGINSAILTRGGGSNGVGFAIPANLVAAFIAQAKAGAHEFSHPWAGLTGQPMDAQSAEAMGLDHPDGVLLSALHPDSPFARAGIAAGDVLLSVDGFPVESQQEILYRLAVRGTDARTEVTWLHDGHERQATVVLAAAPRSGDKPVTIRGNVVLRGLSVAMIDPARIEAQNLPLSAKGVVVTGAEDLAARIGLQEGDVLQAINGKEVKEPGDVERLAGMQARLWVLDILRDGQQIQLRFRI